MAYDPNLGYDPDGNGKYNGRKPSLIGQDFGFSQEFGKRKPDVEIGPVQPVVSTMGAGSGSGSGVAVQSYTEDIAADSGLTDEELAQIQQYREQAKAGLITWEQANQLANAVRARHGYSVDKTGASTPTQQDPYGSWQDYLESMGYGDYADQTRAAIEAAVEAAIQNYNQQIAQTEQDSGKLARQAYVAKMMGQKNLDQQLSAEGYAGGMADSQRIQAELSYQNQLSEIEQQRLLTVQELQNAIAQAKLSGDLQTAQELASYLQQVQSQWASYVSQRQQTANSDYWNQKSMDEQNRANAYERAMNLLSAGITPDAATLAAAGISAQEAAQILRYYGGGASSGGTGGGTGGGSSSGSGTNSYRGGGGYSNGSLSAAQVQQLQRALGVTADGKWGAKSSAAAGGLDADAAWAKYGNDGSGMNGSYFNAAMSSLRAALDQGHDEGALSGLESMWGKLSDQQKSEVQKFLARYGIAYEEG